jgi:hypothetical protein
MVLVSEDKYKETLQILRNKKQLLPIYLELKMWLKERFDITSYNFVFEKIKYNNPDNRYQLYILLSTKADYISMMEKNLTGYDKNKQTEISQKFYELALKYSFGNEKSVKNVWVCYNDFSAEMKTDVNRRTYKEAGKPIKAKYGKYSLWNIVTSFESVVVFFLKDSDINENTKNGISEKIRNDYLETLKKHDEFNVYKPNEFTMSFDSKENLDTNYEGNLYYYFK